MKNGMRLFLFLMLALCLCMGPAAAEEAEGNEQRQKTAVEVNNESRRIEGDISVRGRDENVTGLLVNEDRGGAIEVTLVGSVTAAAETDSYDHQDCTAVSVNASGEDSEVFAKLDGNISATNVWTAGEEMNLDDGALSVWAGDGGKAEVTVSGDLYADARLLPGTREGYTWSAGLGAYTGGTGAEVEVTVNGNVTASGDSYSVGINANNDETGTVLVRVTGDVRGDSLGVRAINWNEDSRIDVVVDGTVKQSESGVSLEGTCPENIFLTFWQAEETGRNHIVSVDGEMTEEQAAEAEQRIRYILRTEENSAGYITAEAQEYLGFRVAGEGEAVKLRVDAPDGFRVVSVGGGRAAPEQDADGNWFLRVPRGGGVELSVDLEQQISLFHSEDTPQTAALKAALAEALPAEAKELLPAGEKQAAETATLRLVCPVPAAVTVDTDFYLKAFRPRAEGETVTVLLALAGEEQTEWLRLDGTGAADGSVRITLTPEQLRLLSYRVFLAVIL